MSPSAQPRLEVVPRNLRPSTARSLFLVRKQNITSLLSGTSLHTIVSVLVGAFPPIRCPLAEANARLPLPLVLRQAVLNLQMLLLSLRRQNNARLQMTLGLLVVGTAFPHPPRMIVFPPGLSPKELCTPIGPVGPVPIIGSLGREGVLGVVLVMVTSLLLINMGALPVVPLPYVVKNVSVVIVTKHPPTPHPPPRDPAIPGDTIKDFSFPAPVEGSPNHSLLVGRRLS